jgi:predicted component of type VI protein secretion system
MPAQLLALTEGPSILLDKPILLLGRHPECDIQLESRKVSRRHCCIAQVGNHLVVRDLGSTNGIRINGVRLLEGCLKAGDELTIGSHRYQVKWDEMAVAGARVDSGKATGRPPVQPIPPPPPPGDDALLEECDEPVPLAEPAGAPVPALPGRKVPPPVDAPSPAAASSSSSEEDGSGSINSSLPEEDEHADPALPGGNGPVYAPPAPDEPRSRILPEELQLAPSSDVFPGQADPPKRHDSAS